MVGPDELAGSVGDLLAVMALFSSNAKEWSKITHRKYSKLYLLSTPSNISLI